MTTVYVVQIGEYSDRHVIGVYSSAEQADAVAAPFSQSCYNFPSVRAWELDAPSTDGVYTEVEVRKDGTVDYTNTYTYNRPGPEDYRHKSGVWSFHVETADTETAIKVANERRAMLLANGLWDKEAK